MATRAQQIIEQCTTTTRTVETGQTVAVGDVVKDGNAEGECQRIAATSDLPIGVVTALGKLAGAAGDIVTIAYLIGGVHKVRVGAGGATRGASAKYVSAGRLTDVVVDLSAPAAQLYSPGFFTQTGVDGDWVGMALLRHFAPE